MLISDPVGYGIIAYNMHMLGHNIIENFSVHMRRQKPFESFKDNLSTCSYGLHLDFFDSDDLNMLTSTAGFITISKMSLTMLSDFTMCKNCCGLNYYRRFRRIFEIYLKQHNYRVVLAITNSSFSHLIGNIMMVSAESLLSNSISFDSCEITKNNNFGKLEEISQFE